MLALEQSVEKWPFSAGGGASDRSEPPLGSWQQRRPKIIPVRGEILFDAALRARGRSAVSSLGCAGTA